MRHVASFCFNQAAKHGLTFRPLQVVWALGFVVFAWEGGLGFGVEEPLLMIASCFQDPYVSGFYDVPTLFKTTDESAIPQYKM